MTSVYVTLSTVFYLMTRSWNWIYPFFGMNQATSYSQTLWRVRHFVYNQVWQ
jgi:hypothetical protein